MMSVPNVEVVSAVTGESVAVLRKRGVCRCLSEGVKAALGTADWHSTIPTTAPPRQLPTR